MLVVALVVFAVAVASGSGGGGNPLEAIAKAAEVTQREPGGHAFVRMTVTSSASPEGLTETGPMTFDDDDRAAGTFLVVGHSTGRRVKIEAISDGTTAYTSSSATDPQVTEGKKWAKVDFSSATDQGSTVQAQNGPKEGLKELEKLDGAEEVGKEDIRGVPTTHYRGTVAAAEEVFGVKVQIAPPQIDVWIDSQDRVRRVTVLTTGSVKEGEGPITSEVTVDYFGFGRVPKIEVPAPDEVFDATELVESEYRSAAEGD